MSEVEYRLGRVEALARRGEHALDVSGAEVAPSVREVLDIERGFLADLERDVGRDTQAVGETRASADKARQSLVP